MSSAPPGSGGLGNRNPTKKRMLEPVSPSLIPPTHIRRIRRMRLPRQAALQIDRRTHYLYQRSVLVEVAGSSKHGIHVGHLAGVPAPNVLVEIAGEIEHGRHVGYAAGDPVSNVLVKAAGLIEHAPHVGHLTGAPVPDVLVEAAGTIEHVNHAGHLAGVPAPDVLVKAGTNEHAPHGGHLAGVPISDVLVEIGGEIEHVGHVGHAAGVPAPNVLVEAAFAVEQVVHVRDPGCAGQPNLLIRIIIINKRVQLGPGPFGVGFPIHHAGVAHVRVGTQYGHAVGGPKKQARTITCEGLLEARSDEQEQGQERGRRGHGGCVVRWRATTPNLPALL
eukprot:scaffold397_cov395-Pavlova_lutheri.AAC.13